MGNYLVTGAAGFVGSKVAERLLQSGHGVTTIDNLTTGFLENIPDGVEFIEGGCEDPGIIHRLRKTRFDAIIHIAGQSSGEISFDDPTYDLAANTESTLRLIKYALETECFRFIYTSTMALYGSVPDEPIGEDTTPQPLSIYAVGKLASENYLRIFSRFGLKPTILRYFSIYGPGQNMSNLRQGVVSIFLALALGKNSILMNGSPERFRDFIFIDDIVDITIAVIDDERSFGEIFNVGTGKKTTFGMIIDRISENLGKEITIEYGKGTPGDQHGIYGDVTKLREVLGLTTRVSFEEGMKIMVDWAKGLNKG